MPNATHIYPRGFISMDSGDLIDVTDVKVTTTNNAREKHTLRQPGAGFTIGVEETNVSFSFIVSEDGYEREYIQAVQRGLIKQLRVKIPAGQTFVINGVYKDHDLEIPLDDAIKVSMTFIGHLQR